MVVLGGKSGVGEVWNGVCIFWRDWGIGVCEGGNFWVGSGDVSGCGAGCCVIFLGWEIWG